MREGYGTIRTRIPICGAHSIIDACHSLVDEGDVEEQRDVRGERLSIYTSKTK
jgi:hypothetical protein